jgi:hypothetical protein
MPSFSQAIAGAQRLPSKAKPLLYLPSSHIQRTTEIRLERGKMDNVLEDVVVETSRT